MNKSEFIKAIELYISKGCRFLAFTYRSKGTNELARVVINLGVSYENAKKSDNEKLVAMGVSESAITEEARQGLMKSVTAPEKAQSEGQQNAYINLVKGGAIRFHIESQKLHIFAEVHSKNILEQGVHKVVNSRPLTIEKKHLQKELKLRTAKFRTYLLENILESEVKMNGEVIEIE